jgi:hypothetical protein
VKTTIDGHRIESRRVRTIRGEQLQDFAPAGVTCIRGRRHQVDVRRECDSQVRAALAGLESLTWIAASGGRLVAEVALGVTVERNPAGTLTIHARANGYHVVGVFRTVRHAQVWGTITVSHLHSLPHFSLRQTVRMRGV